MPLDQSGFAFEPLVRYQIRRGPDASDVLTVGSTIELEVMRLGHGAAPILVRVQLTYVKYLSVTNTYEFRGCVMQSGQIVSGLYTPTSVAHGTIRAPQET